MRELHHIGIPTNQKKKNENYMEGAKLYVTDVKDSPNKIEWLRFEKGSPLPEILQKSTHLAYKVDNLKAAMKGHKVVMEPFSPMPGLTVGFIEEEGIPVELMQFA